MTTANMVPIQSVARAFSVLEALAGNPSGLKLADLSRMVGLHKATVYRLVRTMVLLGYVAQTADGEPYRISAQLVDRNSRARPSPTELAPLRRVASRLTNFFPTKRGGAGKLRGARAAVAGAHK